MEMNLLTKNGKPNVPELEKLINSESNFFDLEKDYYKILQNKDTIMHLIKY